MPVRAGMVLRTAGLVAVCCLGTTQAFLAPLSGLQAPSARARTAVPMMSTVEVKAEPGLKVHPTAWKWPKSWPYNGDYFSRKTEASVEINGSPVLTTYYDTPAAAALAGHYKRVLPSNAAILELGASANSYLPEDMTFSSVIGVGVNEEEMKANTRLTERLVRDLNEDQSLPYKDEQFDAVIMANSIEFLTKPREVIREVYRCLKPGGQLIVSFASKNKLAEDKQIKMWGNMNDDQRMWIIGSLMYFACSEGLTQLKGFDLSEGDAKGMMAGLSGKTPCHIVQSVKATFPTDTKDVYRLMMAMLWPAADMDMEDKSLVLSRLKSDYERAESEEDKSRILASVPTLPKVYGVLAQMGGGLPSQLKALLASCVVPRMHGQENELEQLKQGLGLSKASEEFWAPLGKATQEMSAEDKVLLLAECVPMHEGTEDEKTALREMVPLIPQVVELVKAQCPDMMDGDAQLLAVDLVVSDFLHEDAAGRQEFLPWVKTLNKLDMEEYLRMRKEYKGAKLSAAI